MNNRPQVGGIPLKKKHGQNFLRHAPTLLDIVTGVKLTPQTSVFEIGCGDGALTRAILTQDIKQLWVFEIDDEWAEKVSTELDNDRLTMYNQDFLEMDLSILKKDAPWTILANLPYHITFPILGRFIEYRHCLKEGIIMLQEEVAQKIVKKRGRGYGYTSLFHQYYFEWTLLKKIPPTAFYPAPKIFSRLLHFIPKKDVQPIKNEVGFWRFIKVCFKQPRRTLKNNLAQTHIEHDALTNDLLALRAQQLSMEDFLTLWKKFNYEI